MYAACKVVNKNRLGFGRRKKKVLEHIRNEINVLKSLTHPCIIRMLVSYESDVSFVVRGMLMVAGVARFFFFPLFKKKKKKHPSH